MRFQQRENEAMKQALVDMQAALDARTLERNQGLEQQRILRAHIDKVEADNGKLRAHIDKVSQGHWFENCDALENSLQFLIKRR